MDFQPGMEKNGCPKTQACSHECRRVKFNSCQHSPSIVQPFSDPSLHHAGMEQMVAPMHKLVVMSADEGILSPSIVQFSDPVLAASHTQTVLRGKMTAEARFTSPSPAGADEKRLLPGVGRRWSGRTCPDLIESALTCFW